MREAYDQWYQALSEEFFSADRALQDTVLYVDDETVQDLAQRFSIETSLPEAVSASLGWVRDGTPLLTQIVQRCQIWSEQGRDGAPPSLPVLAASVLAATRMASSDGMRRTNYRGRWYQLFGVPQQGHEAYRLDRALDDVAAMWQELDSWLDETGGLYGASTVSTGEYYWRIGYPVSQALVRRSDRHAMTRFFAATRLQPGNAARVPGRELLRRLVAWTAGHHRGFSDRFTDEVRFASSPTASEQDRALIVPILDRLAASWDGTLHEPTGNRTRRALGLRLAVTNRERRLEWLADTAEGIDETVVQISGGRSFTLRADYGGVYSGLETLEPSEPQLRSGVRLEGESLVIEWAPQDVILLRIHPDLGEWVSTDCFVPGSQHMILASTGTAAQVRTMLRSLGAHTPRESPAPVPGWVLFKGVRASNGAQFTQTLESGSAHTHVLRPEVRHSTKLVGGLRIAKEYRASGAVAGHFLRGGEPDLLLPSPETPDGTIDVVLDGQTSSLKPDPRFPFPLHLLTLPEGEHRIGTASTSQVFTVHDGFHEGLPDGTGSLGYACDSTAALQATAAGSEGAWIKGASAPGGGTSASRTVTVRNTVLEACFLDARGGVVRVRKREAPDWMKNRVPDAAAQLAFASEVPDEAVWFVYHTPQRWWVRAVHTSDPLPDPEPSWEDFGWAYAVLSADSGGRCEITGWHLYVEAAQAIVNRRDGSAG
ncbi:hypothetical protein [Streptomyces sp. NPDC056144]|uniref:hypothetical protein n=1 Tax=unclassified Streptomyces TaxID=2593676 RepID=UPI0035D7A58A